MKNPTEREGKPPPYKEYDYESGQRMLTLRTEIDLTQKSLSILLNISRRSVGEWEAGISYPNANHLKDLIRLGIQTQAFPEGEELDHIRNLWKTTHQRILLNEKWALNLVKRRARGEIVFDIPSDIHSQKSTPTDTQKIKHIKKISSTSENNNYRKRDYASGDLLLMTRRKICLTQRTLGELLKLARHSVGQWEAGISYPNANHLKDLIRLGIQTQAFPEGEELKHIRELWKATRQKALFNEKWALELVKKRAQGETVFDIDIAFYTPQESTPDETPILSDISEVAPLQKSDAELAEEFNQKGFKEYPSNYTSKLNEKLKRRIHPLSEKRIRR